MEIWVAMSEQNSGDFNAFGNLVPADFRGNFDNASVRDNVSQTANGAAIQTAEAGKSSRVGWTFESGAGRRAIFVRYASKDERPCEISVNDAVVQSHALFESTETLKLVDWRYQCTVELQAGENSLVITGAKALPFIQEIAIVDANVGEMLSVDEFWDQREARRADKQLKRPLVVEPSSLRGALDMVRGYSNDDAAVRRLATILAEFSKAAQLASVNGQAANPWGGPLNGQRYRQQIFAAMMRVGPDAIIETGTYVGASTAHFARQGIPVHTCESQDQFFARALANLADFSNVSVYLQDSRAFLSGLASDPAIDFSCPIFYLDAHWYNDLPLAEEIAIIRDRWPRFMIMVDDFEVPGAQYGFDRYPNGLELTLNYLRNENTDFESMAVMFPTAAETAETSVRRGTLMLSSLDIFESHLKFERTMYRYRPQSKDAQATTA